MQIDLSKQNELVVLSIDERDYIWSIEQMKDFGFHPNWSVKGIKEDPNFFDSIVEYTLNHKEDFFLRSDIAFELSEIISEVRNHDDFTFNETIHSVLGELSISIINNPAKNLFSFSCSFTNPNVSETEGISVEGHNTWKQTLDIVEDLIEDREYSSIPSHPIKSNLIQKQIKFSLK